MLAGAAALLYTLRVPNGIIYYGGFILGIKAFCAAVLGGIGNLRGALLGGLILGVMENYGQVLFGTGWRDVVAFVLLILILMFRPTGILGEITGEGAGMSTNPSFDQRAKGGVGDSFRSWWNALSRPAQWLFGAPFIVLLALLPLLNIPVLTTQGSISAR